MEEPRIILQNIGNIEQIHQNNNHIKHKMDVQENEIGPQPQEPAVKNDEGHLGLVNLLLRKEWHEGHGTEADGDMTLLEKNLKNLEEDSGFDNKYYVGVKKVIRAAKRYWMLKIESHEDF